jgi:O-antigen/teichoic acid export membrane protein
MELIRRLLRGEGRDIILYTASGGFAGFVGILTGPLILAKAGLADYGALGLAAFVFTFFSTWTDFGIQAHLISAGSTNRPSPDFAHEAASAFGLKALLLAAAGLAYLAYWKFYPHPPLVKTLAGFYLIVLPCSTSNFEWYFIGRSLHFRLAVSRFLTAAASVLLIVWWYRAGEGISFIPLSVAASQALGAAYLAWRIRLDRRLAQFAAASWCRIGQLFKLLLPVAGTQVLSPFFLGSGIFLMERVGAPAESIGAYGVAQRVIIGWSALIVPLVFFFIPKSRPAGGGNPFLGRLAASGGISLMLMAAGLGIIGFYYWFSGASPDYLRFSALAYSVLLVGIFLNLLRLKYVSALVAEQRYHLYFLIHLAAALPVMAAAVFPPYDLPLLLVAGIACLPEAIATACVIAASRPGGFGPGVEAIPAASRSPAES